MDLLSFTNFNPTQFLFENIQEKEEKQEYVLYACYGGMGAYQKTLYQGKEYEARYSPMFWENTLLDFKNALVDLDHNGIPGIIGKVIDTWMNDSGFKTEGGTEVKKDRMPWCKMIVILTKSQRERAQGVSTQFTPIINQVSSDAIEITGVNTSQPVYISFLVEKPPRMPECSAIYNTGDNEYIKNLENNEKPLDNYNNVAQNKTNTNMTEEEINKLIESKVAETVAAKMAELEAKPTTEAIKNTDMVSQDTVKEKEIKNEDEMVNKTTTESGVLEEIQGLKVAIMEIKNLLTKADQKIVENADNAPNNTEISNSKPTESFNPYLMNELAKKNK
jgi:hypothetical protein